jgi:NAD+ synthase (glutamine-hydrolysing)
MQLLRIGLASVDTTVGATRTNTDKAVRFALEMAESGCMVGVFQEQLFGGYPAEDLVSSEEFIRRQGRELMRFAKATRTCDMVFAIGVEVSDNGLPYNASAIVCRGRVCGIVPKEHLPSYGVFDERRVFTAGVAGLYREITLSGSYGSEDEDTRVDDQPVPGAVPFGDLVFESQFGSFTTCVCEDIWAPDGPMARRAIAPLHLVVNASPARQGVVETREQMLATRSADHECIIAAAYQVGGDDSLVFDGGGYVFQNGQLIDSAPKFREGFHLVDIDLSRTERMRKQNTTWRARQESIHRKGETFRRIKIEGGPIGYKGELTREFASRFSFLPHEQHARERALAYMVESCVAGLKGYFEKSGAFKKILIALSGGKDSFITLLLAWLYARQYVARFPAHERAQRTREFLTCVSMPTRFNSEETKSISREICEELGVELIEASIEEELMLAVKELTAMTRNKPDTLTLGNIQARIRGERMWNLSNMTGAMWLQTGNMSEKAVGYTTIGADLMGAYSLIGNMPKTVVGEVIEYLGRVWEIRTVAKIMATRASAELAEGQFDEDDLMPFPVLDLCFLLFAGELYSPADMYRIMRARWTDSELKAMAPRYEPGALKIWIERFLRLFRQSIYKWVQAPQAVHLGSLDLDRERALQIPVITSPEWFEESIKEMQRMH